jgi:hypothetical protein
MPAIAAVAFISFACCACGPRITNDNVEVVNEQRAKLEAAGKGLSPKEVESILGQPTRSERAKLPLETQKKEVEVVRFYYDQDGQTLELHFVDGKLINNVPLLKPDSTVPTEE